MAQRSFTLHTRNGASVPVTPREALDDSISIIESVARLGESLVPEEREARLTVAANNLQRLAVQLYPTKDERAFVQAWRK